MKKMPTLGFFKDIQKKITNNSGSGKILILSVNIGTAFVFILILLGFCLFICSDGFYLISRKENELHFR